MAASGGLKFVTIGLAAFSVVGLSSLAYSEQAAGSANAADPASQNESTLAEIVVTAQKREQRLSDVGLTIAAFSGDELERQGITRRRAAREDRAGPELLHDHNFDSRSFSPWRRL